MATFPTYAIWVAGAKVEDQGYLTYQGRVSYWYSDAVTFGSHEEALAHLVRMGYQDCTDAGPNSAYVIRGADLFVRENVACYETSCDYDDLTDWQDINRNC